MTDNNQERVKGLSPRSHQIREFCANTTAHGIGKVAEAMSWPARMFWMLIFATAFICSVYEITRSFQEYMKHPTQTEVSLATREKLIFPAVTVCNLNPLKLSNLINTSLWDNVTSLDDEDDQFDFVQFKDQLFSSVLTTYKQDVCKLGHQGEDLIVNCRLPASNQRRPCSFKSFSQWFDMDYGNCYSINTSGLFVTQAGERQGFKLTLFIDANEYIGHLADSVGAVVSLHSPYLQSRNLDNSPIFVSPGTAVSVALTVQNLSRLDYPFNKGKYCNGSNRYAEKICLKQCVAEKMRRDCGCVQVTELNQPTCGSPNETQGLDETVCDPTNGTLSECVAASRNAVNFPECLCNAACREIHFIQSVSTSVWPSKSHMPMLLKSLSQKGKRAAKVVTDLESARNNMVQVNIHYASMTVKNIRQTEAMTWLTLLGDVGGQLGLFIGVSCITVVEFLSLLCHLIQPVKKNSIEEKVFHPSMNTDEISARNQDH